MTGHRHHPRSSATTRRRVPEGYQHLRPKPRLFRQAIAALLAFAIPAFGVVYFVTIPLGSWLPVLVAQALVSALFLLATWSFFRVGIWVHSDGIVERGFFGLVTRIGSERIGSTVLVHAFYGGDADTVPQFFVRDHEGRQVVRMRGQFWSPESIAAVRDTLGVPTSEQVEGMSTRDISLRYPGLLYWFERRPVLALSGLGLALLCGGAIAYFALSALAVPPTLAS